MSIKAAMVYGDVTKKYILDSLNYQYRGKNFEFSDDLITILKSDFDKKAKNLDWLFQGKVRLDVAPSSTTLFEALQKDDIAKDFIIIAETMGYTIDPENFTAGYLVQNKQLVKFHTAYSHMRTGTAPVLPNTLSKPYTETKVMISVNKYRPESSGYSTRDLVKVGEVIISSNSFGVNAEPERSVVSTWSRSIDVDSISDKLNSSNVVMSLDINDYITCSEGSFSSCMSMNSSSTRHLGWMMHYRSDFSIISFTHKKGNTFYKTGRAWTFLKLTEDAMPYPRPFYKLSRVYGQLNDGHIGAIDAVIQKQISEVLKLGDPTTHKDHKAAKFGSFKNIASPNMQNTNSNYQGTGYFDWPSDNTAYWDRLPLWEYPGKYKVVPFDSEVYSQGPICIFNFPDALNVLGQPTNESLFRNEPFNSYNAVIGWNEHYIQFVTCQITGEKTLLSDSLEISEKVYIHKDQAIRLLAGKPLEVIESTAPAATVIEVVELSDEDVTDF